MVDMARARREDIRWQIVLVLNNGRPYAQPEQVILSVIRATYADATQIEIRRELDYLEERDLIHIQKLPDGRWLSELGRLGVDLAEYTVECDPGIGRPTKYWTE